MKWLVGQGRKGAVRARSARQAVRAGANRRETAPKSMSHVLDGAGECWIEVEVWSMRGFRSVGSRLNAAIQVAHSS